MIFRGLESSGTGTLTYFRLTLFSDEIVAFATYLCFIVIFENEMQSLIKFHQDIQDNTICDLHNFLICEI